MKKIYISGKITGMEEEAALLFEQAEQELRAMGFEPVNPMKLNHDHDKSWESYMKVCIKALCECDIIYMLKNFNDSPGAWWEREIARRLNIKVIYQRDAADSFTF